MNRNSLASIAWGVVLWAVVSLAGCKPVPPAPPPAPMPMIVQDQAPLDMKTAFAPAVLDSTAIAGQVFLKTPHPQQKLINTLGKTKFPVRLPTEDVMGNLDGTVQNVVVYVKKGIKEPFASPLDKPLIYDSHSYRFSPHVLAVQAGREVVFRNADPDVQYWIIKGRNYRTISIHHPTQGMATTKVFNIPEMGLEVSSRHHPWMSGRICVIPHQYFNVTNTGGVFRIDYLPPGTYTIATWHETLGEREQTITLRAGQLVRMRFDY